MKIINKKWMKMLERKEKEIIKKNVLLVVYENDKIEKEILEWINYLGIDSFGDVLLDIGFKCDDVVYLYSKGINDLEFYYSVNEDVKNVNNIIHISYGDYMDRGSQITINNNNISKSFVCKNNNKFELDLEINEVSDVITYERYYFSFSSLFRVKCNVKDKDYELKLNIYRSFDNNDIFKLNNESELEKYLCSLELPVSLLDIFMGICEISSIDLSNYDSFELELCKGNINNKEVISHIKFINGEFISLSYINDCKKIVLNSSGDWLCEMIDDDDLVKLSISFSDDTTKCSFVSKNDKEIDEYIKYFALYDINNVRCEIEETKKLVKSICPKK